MRWWLVVLGACAGEDSDPPIRRVWEPFLEEPALRENPDAGLTLFLDLVLDAPTLLRVTIDDGRRVWTQEVQGGLAPEVLLLGFTPGSEAEIRVDSIGGTELYGTRTLRTTIPPLPEGFPTFTVSADADAMEPGVTLIASGGLLVMVDPEGVPVWFKEVDGVVHGTARFSDGSLAYVLDRSTVEAVDLAGRSVRRWRARTADEPDGIAVDVESFHHDVVELPDGGFASLSVERRQVEDYPADERTAGTTAPAWVAGDVIVEVDADGTVRRSLPLLDLLDPTRIAYDAVVGDFWEDFGSWRGDDVKDWSHGNALWHDAPTDSWLVSLRHQDAVIAVSRATGTLRAILAPPANWPPELDGLLVRPAEPAGFAYAYHQHGAKTTPDGNVLMFDNGNRRASAWEPVTPDAENTSRCVEYTFHDATTYEVAFEYVGPFSGSLGDCDLLPETGNHLVTFGNVKDPALPGVRIVEVTPDGTEVFVLEVPQPATAFRAERMPGLIPGY